MSHHNDKHHDHPTDQPVEPIMRPVEELEAEAQLGPEERRGGPREAYSERREGDDLDDDTVVAPLNIGAGQLLGERPLPVVVRDEESTDVFVDPEEDVERAE